MPPHWQGVLAGRRRSGASVLTPEAKACGGGRRAIGKTTPLRLSLAGQDAELDGAERTGGRGHGGAIKDPWL